MDAGGSVGRVHIGAAGSPLEAGVFLSSSLLLSHGVRQGVSAAVRLGGKWIVVRSSEVRRLYPDADSLEGWVKAVLRGRPLGASVVRGSFDHILSLLGLGRGRLLCVEQGEGRWIGVERLGIYRGAVYGGGLCSEAGAVERVFTPAPPSLAPALVNILWDRADAGLGVPEPCRRC
ncbi:hypothetical protein APE_1734.1 [Aeropyrum pernix K1]|uniref:Uncharacterized protein n=1 Tax=Aeropyrum pernix (strain ATCC 700893 / DSM 11879 / JCM 9820 / NBRC 100138 / K1) TaxID=272557 RepID=Q9YB63_AERPE|nr:hypothetical protein [Aeropyrum pernix]BAA80735.2 hypothetical protein APE_1734.1 [Aeropyrum pernix K1]